MGELRLRDAQQFGLTAGNFAVQLRVTEQRRSHPLFPHLGGFALREKLLVTHVTTAARDLERNDDPVSDPQVARSLGPLLGQFPWARDRGCPRAS